jgi:hypothetical protein
MSQGRDAALGRAFLLANESTSQAGQWLGARYHGLGTTTPSGTHSAWRR